MSYDDRGIIPTATLQGCSDYADKLIAIIRESHSKGRPMTVEQLTFIQLFAIEEDRDPIPDKEVIQQQALMIAVCLQRLAARRTP